MFKIYPDKYIQNQMILKSSDLKNKIIFTLLEQSLEIIYGEMHMKISKDSIKNVIIKKINDMNFIKIFLILEKNINMEYILFSNNIDILKIKDFFINYEKNNCKRKI